MSEEPIRKARRRFDEQFKRDAVQLCTDGGRSISDVAHDLGLRPEHLRKWVEKYAPGKKTVLKSAEQLELERLRRELARVTEEREILKKALAVFSRHQR